MIAAALLLLVPCQRMGSPAPLQPATHVSPSGAFRLYVDPSSPRGSGPARYRLERQGVEVWAGERPFTLWDARVDDRGFAGGYGYSEGIEGKGSLVVLILSPEGDVLVHEDHPRRSQNFSHSSPVPWGSGILLVQERDQLLVRVHDGTMDACSEEWWSYELSDGAAPRRFRLDLGLPDGEPFFVQAAQSVPGTPLVLVHVREFRSLMNGACFALLDESWKPIWTLRIPGDYFVGKQEDEAALGRLLEQGRGMSTSPGGFTVMRFKDRERVTYGLVPARGESGGWTVTELERAPLRVEGPTESPRVRAVELEEVAAVFLGPPREPDPSPVRDVLAFAVDSDRSIRFLRGEEHPNRLSAVHVTPTGDLIESTGFELPEPRIHVRWTPLDEARWLGIRLASGTVFPASDDLGKAWVLDPRTGTVEELEGFDARGAGKIASSEDRFAVARLLNYGGRPLHAVNGYDTRGTALWEHRTFSSWNHEDPTQLVSPDDIALGVRGELAVLEHTGIVQVFEPHGAFQRSIDLAPLLGGDDRYFSQLEAARDEWVVLVRAPGVTLEEEWWRIATDGSAATRLDLRLPEDGSNGRRWSLLRDPADGWWATNGRSILELDESGSVRGEMGPAEDPTVLQEPGAVFLDRFGRIGIGDERSNVVHVFDAHGTPLCRLATGRDLISPYRLPYARVTDEGGWLIPDSRGTRHVVFDRTGTVSGLRTLGTDIVALVPGTDRFWVRRDENGVRSVIERAGDGAPIGTIERLPDGRWFSGVLALATSDQGELALLDRGGRTAALLALYSADGKPERMFELPTQRYYRAPTVVYGTTWILVSDQAQTAYLVRRENGEVLDVSTILGAEEAELRGVGLSPDETELWCVDAGKRTLHRFELPD